MSNAKSVFLHLSTRDNKTQFQNLTEASVTHGVLDLLMLRMNVPGCSFVCVGRSVYVGVFARAFLVAYA